MLLFIFETDIPKKFELYFSKNRTCAFIGSCGIFIDTHGMSEIGAESVEC